VKTRFAWAWMFALAACGGGDDWADDRSRAASEALDARAVDPAEPEYLWDCAAVDRKTGDPMYDVPCSCFGVDANGDDVAWDTVHERYLTVACAPDDGLIGGAINAVSEFGRQCKVHCAVTAPANVTPEGGFADADKVYATCTLQRDSDGKPVPC